MKPVLGLGPAIAVVIVATAVVVTMRAGTSGHAARSDQIDRSGDVASPVRTSPPLPMHPAPPSVPDQGDALGPVSFRVTTVWEQAGRPVRRLTQRVTRTRERVRLVPDGATTEWWFVRNPVDPRRVTGFLVDHEAQQILVHEERDLHARQQIRGWADVLTLRFAPELLQALRTTGEQESAGGATFARYVAPDAAAEGVVEVWWSDAALLPLRLTVRRSGSVMTSVLDRFDNDVDLDAMGADPRARFSAYRVLDVVDTHEHH